MIKKDYKKKLVKNTKVVLKEKKTKKTPDNIVTKNSLNSLLFSN